MAIDKNFVVTTDSIEGYRIVKYLGVVFGRGTYLTSKRFPECTSAALSDIIAAGEISGANAIISIKNSMASNSGGPSDLILCGTAVVVEPIIQ